MSPVMVDRRPTVDGYHSAMKPIAEIRRARLEQLIREDFGGRAQALADKTGKDRRQISAWRKYKDMRDDTAREIEAACLKPLGWLDNEGLTLPKVAEPERPASQSMTPDPDILHEALILLVHDESVAGPYSPREQSARLSELIGRVTRDGGRLTKEHNAQFVEEVRARSEGVTDGARPERHRRASSTGRR